METAERIEAILSKFYKQYFFVVVEDNDTIIGLSDSAFARSVLPGLEHAIDQMEHKEAKRKAHEARDAEEKK